MRPIHNARSVVKPPPLERRRASPALARAAIALLAVALAAVAAIQAANGWNVSLTSDQRRALASVTPASLEAHVSFLSADALQGRGSGSQGLEVAAEYIAAQFRRAGLKPAADGSFFQVTPRLRLTPASHGFACRITSGALTLNVPPQRFALGTPAVPRSPIRLDGLPVVKVPFDPEAISRVQHASGVVVATEVPAPPAQRTEMAAYSSRLRDVTAKIGALKPAAVLQVRRQVADGSDYLSRRVLVDPAQRVTAPAPTPVVSVWGDDAWKFYDALPEGSSGATFTLHVPAPIEASAPQPNVVAMMTGSDPRLSESYVLVTAHYDGQGERPGQADSIWNSANDNASGTVAVIEVASALGSLRVRPRRSIVFIAFHGEESGLVGSRYYAQHPVVPHERTVAAINIEMVGRTDDVEGDQKGKASVTGFDFTEVGEVLRRAGTLTGLTVFKHPKNSDSYFGRSDNGALAAAGVPAHTICSTFQYADYHGAADTADKIDYEHMAKTVRTIAAGVLILAQSDREPRWNAALKQTGRYLEAWKKLHAEAKRSSGGS